MYKKLDRLISSDRYKSLKLCRVDNKIYTEKYKNKYNGYADVLITDEPNNLVCEYDKYNNYFIFGLIKAKVIFLFQIIVFITFFNLFFVFSAPAAKQICP